MKRGCFSNLGTSVVYTLVGSRGPGNKLQSTLNISRRWIWECRHFAETGWKSRENGLVVRKLSYTKSVFTTKFFLANDIRSAYGIKRNRKLHHWPSLSQSARNHFLNSCSGGNKEFNKYTHQRNIHNSTKRCGDVGDMATWNGFIDRLTNWGRVTQICVTNRCHHWFR